MAERVKGPSIRTEGHAEEEEGGEESSREAREMCVLFGGFYLMILGVGGFYLTMFLMKPPKSKGRK